jgi:hypothetical protein
VVALFFATLAQAGSKVVKVEARRIAPYLFHWTPLDSLREPWRLEIIREKDTVPLPWIRRRFLITQAFPDLEWHSGLFSWPHPVTGLGTGPAEVYGDVPIFMKTVEEPVRVLDLRTQPGSEIRKGTRPVDDIDVVYHRRYDRKRVLQFEEYVILRPENAVEDFSADPRIIQPLIAPEIERLKRGEAYPAKLLHHKVEGGSHMTEPFFHSASQVRRTILPTLRRYMRLDSRSVPERWRRPLEISCAEGFQWIR